MEKAMAKEDFKEYVQDMVHAVKIASAVITIDAPGAGHLLIECLIDELQELLPKGATCCKEGPGVESVACDGAVGMTFGDALAVLKGGGKVARKGWNGKNQYVELATCISYKNAAGEAVNADHCSIGNKALAFVGTSGVQLGWLASQADMLAEDWYIVE